MYCKIVYARGIHTPLRTFCVDLQTFRADFGHGCCIRSNRTSNNSRDRWQHAMQTKYLPAVPKGCLLEGRACPCHIQSLGVESNPFGTPGVHVFCTSPMGHGPLSRLIPRMPQLLEAAPSAGGRDTARPRKRLNPGDSSAY